MNEALGAFLTHFSNPKRTGKQWLVQCPAHEDKTASMTIDEGETGCVLVHCHAGCTVESILARLNLDESALFPPRAPSPEIVATYDYQDESSQLLYQVVRYNPKDFRQRKPNGNGWEWKLEGVRRVLYRLPELAKRQAIIIFEGEKDVDAAWRLGIPATTNAGGAGKWLESYAEQLRVCGTKRVAIVPDNDIPGEQHAAAVAQSLFSTGIEVRIVRLPHIGPKGDFSDYLAMGHTGTELLALARKIPLWTPESSKSQEPEPVFRQIDEGRYVLAIETLGLEFEVDRLHRERHELFCELTVRCDVAGVATVDGVLSVGTFNLLALDTRKRRAKQLKEQTQLDVDFGSFLEELCQRAVAAERNGAPARSLHTYERPGADAEFNIEGLRLLRHHNQIWFGDGGSLKSYLALYAAGQLALSDFKVLFCDWELSGEEHRERLERLFGESMPDIGYMRCERPLIDEVDRIRRHVQHNKVDFVIYDSIAPACAGPPEAAEHATAYFRATRRIGVGGLHLAHINRSENGESKPFGSSFWHNLARSTWFVKQAGASANGSRVSVGLFNKKSNLTRLYPAVALEFNFNSVSTLLRRVDPAAEAELAKKLPLWQRVEHVVQAQPLTYAELAKELDGAKLNSIIQAVDRAPELFTVLTNTPDGVHRVALVTH